MDVDCSENASEVGKSEKNLLTIYRYSGPMLAIEMKWKSTVIMQNNPKTARCTNICNCHNASIEEM